MQNFINSFEWNGCSENNNITINQSACIYGIEEHLKQFRDLKSFNILYNCWMIEKEEYAKRLNAVAMTYQTYSLHDATHSETILRQIAYFLGEKRVRQLSPTDAWLILECAYCHDLGMVVTAKDLYFELVEMEKEDYKEFSREMRESQNVDVRLSWSYLEPLFEYGYRERHGGWEEETAEKRRTVNNLNSIFESGWHRWPEHFIKAFKILIQERSRPKHAQMSHDIIMKEADEKSYEGLIPLRFRYLIAKIAAMHMEQREDIIEKLSQEIQGFDGDYAHPRFVAELIRIGDLLDIDNNRFNKYQLAVAGDASYNSFTHQMKHRALRDFLVTPERIRVEADFSKEDAKKIFQMDGLEEVLESAKKQETGDDLEENADRNLSESAQNEEDNAKKEERTVMLALKAFKELSGWLQMLHQEIDFFSKNWLKIVPEGLTGTCPYFEPEKLSLDGKYIENDLIDLRYHITAKRSSEIIEGIGLYKNIFVAVIREIIQNSMDAVKRKVYFDLKRRGHGDFNDPLEFYRYILRDEDELTIKIECGIQSANKNIRLKIRDYGIGITYERLKEMQHIGHITNYETSQEAKNMPAWWKPTGSFGIGMQSIFNLSKEFKLITRTQEEGLLRKMRFHSTQIGGKIDSYIINDSHEVSQFKFGTEIEIDIPTEMVCIFEQSGHFKRELDCFGNTENIFQSEIQKAVKIIRGSFGIPIRLILPGTEKDEAKDPDTNQYLLRCFGKYFIQLPGKKNDYQASITKVLMQDVDLPDEQKYLCSGFACWSEENHMLLRYRWKKEKEEKKKGEEEKGSFKIYFNEIRVKDKKITKLFKNNFFDMEAYFFDKSAENFLEINRDRFLYERRRHIIDLICSTNLNCLSFLMDINGEVENPAEQDYKRAIWEEEAEWYIYEQASVRDYFKFLLKKENIESYIAGVKWFLHNEDRIRQTESLAETFFPIGYDELWLMDVRKKYTYEIHLRRAFQMQERCIIEDVFPCCMELAVSKLICMQENSGDYVVLYKVERRSGRMVAVDDESFKAYLHMRYQELEQKGLELARIVLPGIEKYRELCVSKLPGNMGTLFEKKLNSAIIMPIIAKEMKQLLKKREEQEAEQLIDSKFLDKHKVSYGKIVEYIQEFGAVRDLKEEDIRKAYRSLLLEMWKNLPKEKEDSPDVLA